VFLFSLLFLHTKKLIIFRWALTKKLRLGQANFRRWRAWFIDFLAVRAELLMKQSQVALIKSLVFILLLRTFASSLAWRT
jgi:hypothetical protein